MVIYGLLWSNILNSVWKYWDIENPFVKLAVETVISTTLLLFFEFIFKAFFRATNNAITGKWPDNFYCKVFLFAVCLGRNFICERLRNGC